MAAGKTTHAIDRITAKLSGLTLIECDVAMGATTAMPLTSVPLNGYITRKQFQDNMPPPPVQVTFGPVSTFTINWQTDIPAGGTLTYVQLMGNLFPKPFAYVTIATNTYVWATSVNLTVTYDGSGNLLTVVFDFGASTSGYIQF